VNQKGLTGPAYAGPVAVSRRNGADLMSPYDLKLLLLDLSGTIGGGVAVMVASEGSDALQSCVSRVCPKGQGIFGSIVYNLAVWRT
jgi:hypothetical protein